MNDDNDPWYSKEDEDDEISRPESRLHRSKPTPRDAQPALILFAVFAVLSVWSWGQAPDSGYWVSGASLADKQQYWRLVSAIAAHADPAHLLSNMPLFLIFGWFLKTWFGYAGFPLLPLLAGVATNYLTVELYEPHVRLLGASGVVYSMVGLWIVFYLRFETRYRLLQRLLRVTGVSLVLLFPTTFSPRTSYLAHGLGFAVGIILGIIALFFYKDDPQEHLLS